MLTKEELKALELYEVFPQFDYVIGSTTYRKIDHSPMLSCVWVKTFTDKKFRPIKDFFGEEAAIEAQRFCLGMVNN